jgi:hypothetical protein
MIAANKNGDGSALAELPRVYAGEYEKFAAFTDDRHSCNVCGSPFFGDIYALTAPIRTHDNEKCNMVCAMCLHEERDNPFAERFYKIFRVRFPLSIEAAIGRLGGCADVQREALLGVTIGKLFIDGETVHFALVGKKYLAVERVKFLCNNLQKNPMFAGRKLIGATIVV